MLRLARWSLLALTVGVVLGLGWFHAAEIGSYPFVASSRFGWSVAYVVMLAVAAYGVGLPDLPRNVYQALWSALGAAALGALGISVAQLLLGSQLLPRFVVLEIGHGSTSASCTAPATAVSSAPWTLLVALAWSTMASSLRATNGTTHQRHRQRTDPYAVLVA